VKIEQHSGEIGPNEHYHKNLSDNSLPDIEINVG